jgi:aspartyl-tRNA(Asn)/glutamyl-tRNA(Gln) amidotransferase subunit A
MGMSDSIESRVRAAGVAIAEHEPGVNALITDCTDTALEAARSMDALIASGRDVGLLAGMTMLIKDNINTAGIRTTSGAAFFAEHVPNQDAPVVARLRQAGAVILGKSTLHEFAFGIRSHNSVSGQCHNPWDLSRIPGGSSGGSGAAVAANYCLGALGTDTGGSVRLPASFCGISGLRPTVDRVPNTGSTPVCPTQDTIGPMARSVSDVAKIFAVIANPSRAQQRGAGNGPAQAPDLDNFLPALDAGIAGLRIGVPTNMYLEGMESSVGAALHDALRQLESLGATLVDIAVPGAEEMHQWATIVIFADACDFHAERLQHEAQRFDPQVRERMSVGQSYTAVDYSRAMRMRERWQGTLGEVFETVDVIASPTVHTLIPPVVDDKSLLEATKDATRNTYAGAFGQVPGLSIPCGYSSDGLPVGLQLEAAWWNEATLLRAGRAYQNITDWHLQVPPHGAALIK